MKKLFSIGTVIRVGKGEDLLMIVTRFPLTVKNNIKGYYDYGACIYPVGVQANEELYLFNHENISEVVFEGYVNLMEDKLYEYYKSNMSSIKYPRFNINE